MKFRNRLLLLVTFIFFVFYIGLIIFYFHSIKSSSIINFNKRNDLVSKSIVKNIRQFVIENDLNGIKNNIASIQSIEPILNVKLDYYRLIFNSKTLINSMKRVDNNSLTLGDVTIDARYGDVRSLGNGFYEINPTKDLEYVDFVNVKFQIQKSTNIEDDYFPLTFKVDLPNIYYKEKTNWFIACFIDDIKDTSEYSLPIKHLNNHIATISMSFSSSDLKFKIYNIFMKLFFVFTIFISIVFILTIWLLNRYASIGVIAPLAAINNKISLILNDDYHFSEKLENFKVREMNTLNTKLDRLAKKLATAITSLHKSQDLQSKSMFKDALTKLSTKTLFTSDLKQIFVTHSSMFITRIELVSLKELMGVFSKEKVDQFLVDIALILEKQKDTKAYRFFGGEFYIIFKNISYNDNKDKINSIYKEINLLLEKLKIDNFKYFMVSSNIDSYLGTTKNTLSKMKTLLSKAKKDNQQILVHIEEGDVEEFDNLQDTIENIVKNERVQLSYKNKTIRLSNKSLLINDISTSVYDENEKKIYIGVFLSTLTHMGKSYLFDKIVVSKAILNIKSNKISGKLAVTLSYESLLDTNFILWLEDILEDENVANSLVFSFTSYSTSTHLNQLKFFISKFKNYGVQFMITRYSYDELELETIEKLGINYLRLENEFINKFLAKFPISVNIMQHIMISSNLNNYNVLTEKIPNEYEDYLKTIGILGVMQ